jgi:hypothetical protein
VVGEESRDVIPGCEGGRRSGGHVPPFVIIDIPVPVPAVLLSNVRRGRLPLRTRVCIKVDLLAVTDVAVLPPLCPRVLYVFL